MAGKDEREFQKSAGWTIEIAICDLLNDYRNKTGRGAGRTIEAALWHYITECEGGEREAIAERCWNWIVSQRAKQESLQEPRELARKKGEAASAAAQSPEKRRRRAK